MTDNGNSSLKSPERSSPNSNLARSALVLTKTRTVRRPSSAKLKQSYYRTSHLRVKIRAILVHTQQGTVARKGNLFVRAYDWCKKALVACYYELANRLAS